jgi:hypothetical protein
MRDMVLVRFWGVCAIACDAPVPGRWAVFGPNVSNELDFFLGRLVLVGKVFVSVPLKIIVDLQTFRIIFSSSFGVSLSSRLHFILIFSLFLV